MIRPTYVRKMVKVGGAGVAAWQTKEGFHRLRCSCMPFQKKGWCDHITKALDDRLDANSLGPVPDVPIFMEPLLVVPTTLVEVTADMSEVRLLWGQAHVNGAEVRASHFDIVGYYTDGDGRMDLRSMIIAYLRGVYMKDPDAMRCVSPFHSEGKCVYDGMSGDVNIVASMLTSPPSNAVSKQIISDTYHLLDLNFCTWCAQNLENSLQHEDVPF